MNNRDAFHQALRGSNAMALATCADNVPHVRIVNFCHVEDQPGILYFTTDRTNRKVGEFTVNNRIAFTTIPPDGESVPHVRSRNAVVRKSDLALDQVSPVFIAVVPGYDQTLEAIGASLDVYEIVVRTAEVVLDYETVIEVAF